MTPPPTSSAAASATPSVSSEAEPFVIGKLRRRLARQAPLQFDVQLPDGAIYRIGADGAPCFVLRLRTRQALRALESLDESAIGEAYVDGDIDFSGDFLAALDLRKICVDFHPLHSLWRFLRPLLFGSVRSDKDWVARHYDYGNDFYFAFLDRRLRLYSQALFRAEDESLEDAAENKLDYVMRACRLGAGSTVLEVGAGWGSFAGYAAARGVDVTMLTISPEQYRFLSRWSASQDLPGRREAVYESIFAYASPRRFDAIVLLGVMEHLPDYPRLLAKFDALLRAGGRVYMDFAANRRKFNVSSFTYRYIFPGSHTPVVVPELLAAANRTRFEPVALHNDRHSYFLTLKKWARNLEQAHRELADKYGERTYRLFQLYLWGCAHQFLRDGELESYRIVLQKAHGAPSREIGLDL